jgi:hypothetical protein
MIIELIETSKVGKIANECGKEKPIVYEQFSESLQFEKLYCKECHESSN